MIRRSLYLIALILSLSACASHQLVEYQMRDKQTKQTDATIEAQIESKLQNSPWLTKMCHEDCHWEVTAYHHIALVSGQVPSQQAQQAISRLTLNIPHVQRAFNQTQVTAPVSLLQRSKDSWLSFKVKSALLMTKDVPSSAIKVVAQQQVIYLMGNIAAKQQRLAINTARKVDGVKKIVTLMQLPQ